MIGLHRTYKTDPPFISGPVEEMLRRRMNADFSPELQAYNYGYAHEWPIDTDIEFWLMQLQEDYYYHLDGVQFYMPSGTVGAEPPNLRDITYEVIDVARDRTLMQDPIPPRLHTTPADQRQLHYRIRLNHTFLPGSLIKVIARYPAARTDWPGSIYSLTEGIKFPKDYQLDI